MCIRDRDGKGNTARNRQKEWQDLRETMQTEMETLAKEAAGDSKSLLERIQVENRERYDYKEFLRKFSVLKEEMQVDPDSFDYIFYTYGLEHYGNMPLIEPLETKEIRKIEDFVIVIDTSMSLSLIHICNADLRAVCNPSGQHPQDYSQGRQIHGGGF